LPRRAISPRHFQQVQHDVAAYIAKGDGGFSADAPAAQSQAMSLQAMALRQRGGGVIDHQAGGVDSDIQQQFLASIKPWAEAAGAKLGVSADVVAAHAALESGWGQQPLRNGGASSNNLFGIKAGGNWQGAGGGRQHHRIRTRRDGQERPNASAATRTPPAPSATTPKLLTRQSTATRQRSNTGGDARAFASGLAQGGYATDPHYADKLSKLATQLQRGGGMAGVTPSGD
jgi:flagellar protein FlgJ